MIMFNITGQIPTHVHVVVIRFMHGGGVMMSFAEINNYLALFLPLELS